MSNLKDANILELLSIITDFMNATPIESLPQNLKEKKKAADDAILQLSKITKKPPTGALNRCTEQIPTLFGEVGGIYTAD